MNYVFGWVWGVGYICMKLSKLLKGSLKVSVFHCVDLQQKKRVMVACMWKCVVGHLLTSAPYFKCIKRWTNGWLPKYVAKQI
jgi:hypothetical protein